MINFEEELKKFHPALEVDEALEELQGQDQTDLTDLLIGVIRQAEEEAPAGMFD